MEDFLDLVEVHTNKVPGGTYVMLFRLPDGNTAESVRSGLAETMSVEADRDEG